MARQLRVEYEGASYHITARGNERKKIFFSKYDYKKFLEYVGEAKKKYGIMIHCYVLMGNHYHLIMETSKANLSKAMQYINGSYTTYINIKRKRSGHLFQGRYKAIIVDKDNYLLELTRYIHFNPVRAKIVERPDQYVPSSYQSYVNGRKDEVITKVLLLEMISINEKESKRRYREFVESAIGIKLEDPMKEVYGGLILGGISFIKDTLARLKSEYLQQEEIANRKALQSTYGIEDILDFVSYHFQIKREEIAGSRYPEQRKISVYLMKKHTGATNKQIGELFGGISYSGVSKLYRRFNNEIEGNRKLKKKLAGIERGMSNVKV